MFDIVIGCLNNYLGQPMLERLLEAGGHPGASILFAVAWYPCFRWADKFFPENTKNALSNRLHKIQRASWAPPLVSFFDHFLMGQQRQNSFRPSFWRSCCMSIFWVIVLFCVFFISNASVRSSILSLIQRVGFLSTLIQLLVLAVLLNFVLDYISIFQTRVVLHWMTLQKSLGKVFALAVLDFIATTLLVLLSFSVVLNFVTNIGASVIASATCDIPDFCVPHQQIPLGATASGLLSGLTLEGTSGYLSVYIYTTFLTSVWIWFYTCSELILKVLPAQFRVWFPITNYPFQSLGCVFCVVAGLFYFIVVGVSKMQF